VSVKTKKAWENCCYWATSLNANLFDEYTSNYTHHLGIYILNISLEKGIHSEWAL